MTELMSGNKIETRRNPVNLADLD